MFTHAKVTPPKKYKNILYKIVSGPQACVGLCYYMKILEIEHKKKAKKKEELKMKKKGKGGKNKERKKKSSENNNDK